MTTVDPSRVGLRLPPDSTERAGYDARLNALGIRDRDGDGGITTDEAGSTARMAELTRAAGHGGELDSGELSRLERSLSPTSRGGVNTRSPQAAERAVAVTRGTPRGTDDSRLLGLLDEAEANSEDIRAARARLSRARAIRDGVQADRHAQITGTVASDGSFSGNWTIELGGSSAARRAAAEALVEAAEADLEAATGAVREQVASSYYAVVRAQGSTDLVEERIESREAALRVLEDRARDGLANPAEVSGARSRLAAARGELERRRDEESDAQSRLQELVGRMPGEDIEVARALPELTPLPDIESLRDVETRDRLILGNRPDLAAAEARLRAAGLNVEAARRTSFPQLEVGLTGGVDGAASAVAQTFLEALFSGDRREAGVRVAESELQEYAAHYAREWLRAHYQVITALDDEAELASREQAQSTAVQEARVTEARARQAHRQGFDPGGSSYFAAREARIQAEEWLLDTREQRATNRVSLDRALGGGFGDEIGPVHERTPTRNEDARFREAPGALGPVSRETRVDNRRGFLGKLLDTVAELFTRGDAITDTWNRDRIVKQRGREAYLRLRPDQKRALEGEIRQRGFDRSAAEAALAQSLRSREDYEESAGQALKDASSLLDGMIDEAGVVPNSGPIIPAGDTPNEGTQQRPHVSPLERASGAHDDPMPTTGRVSGDRAETLSLDRAAAVGAHPVMAERPDAVEQTVDDGERSPAEQEVEGALSELRAAEVDHRERGGVTRFRRVTAAVERLRRTAAALSREEVDRFVERNRGELPMLATLDLRFAASSEAPRLLPELASKLTQGAAAAALARAVHDSRSSEERFSPRSSGEVADYVVEIARRFIASDPSNEEKLALLEGIEGALLDPAYSEEGVRPFDSGDIELAHYNPLGTVYAATVASIAGDTEALNRAIGRLDDRQLNAVTRGAVQPRTTSVETGTGSYYGVRTPRRTQEHEDPRLLARLIDAVTSAEVDASERDVGDRAVHKARVFQSAVRAVERDIAVRHEVPAWMVGMSPSTLVVRDALIRMLDADTSAVIGTLRTIDPTGAALSNLMAFAYGPNEMEALQRGETDPMFGTDGPFEKVMRNLQQGDNADISFVDYFSRGSHPDDQVHQVGGVRGRDVRRNLGYFLGSVKGGYHLYRVSLRDDTDRLINRDSTRARMLREFINVPWLTAFGYPIVQAASKAMSGLYQGGRFVERKRRFQEMLGRLEEPDGNLNLYHWSEARTARSTPILPDLQEMRRRGVTRDQEEDWLAEVRRAYQAGRSSALNRHYDRTGSLWGSQ